MKKVAYFLLAVILAVIGSQYNRQRIISIIHDEQIKTTNPLSP